MCWLLFVWLHQSRADSLDRAFGRKVARARAGQVARLSAEFEAVRESRLACQIELREARFPLACFTALRREEDWALRSGAERARLLLRLDAKCDRATKRLILPPDSADLANLSPACRARVREGRQIRSYREEERDEATDSRTDSWSGS